MDSAAAANEAQDMRSKIFMVSYVQIHIDDPKKYDEPDIFFAGIVNSMIEAETLARSCSLNLKNGTIIPKILSFEADMKLADMMYDAAEKFQAVLDQMKDMHERLNKGKKKKK